MPLTVPVTNREHIRGATTASMTLLEYGDYQCPRCQQAHLAVKALQSSLANDKPEISQAFRFVFRHFPVVMLRPFAQYTAEVAEAAGAQGQFWPIHDYLFEHPLKQGNGALFSFTKGLGLDMHRFEREVAEHLYTKQIRADIAGGIQSDVNGTPTFFINGIRHDGDWSTKALLTLVEREWENRQKTLNSLE